jgi:hypothetical protein
MKFAIASAKQINEQHRLARASADTAIEHAVLCGQMLTDKKLELGHGNFEAWVEKNCDFALRQAQRYMQASKGDGHLAFDSLRQALGYDKPKKKLEQKHSHSASKSVSRDAFEPAPIARAELNSVVLDIPKSNHLTPSSQGPETEADEPEPERPEWDADEDVALESASMELLTSAEKALGTDAFTEIKRLTAELAVVKMTRDGYMNGKAAMTKLLQDEQRKTARLERKLKDAENELEKLRERVAMMEAA